MNITWPFLLMLFCFVVFLISLIFYETEKSNSCRWLWIVSINVGASTVAMIVGKIVLRHTLLVVFISTYKSIEGRLHKLKFQGNDQNIVFVDMLQKASPHSVPTTN